MKRFPESPPPSAERQATARQLMADTDCISASPPVAFQIFNLVRDPQYSSEALVKLVQLDPELTAQILRLVNSVQMRGGSIASMDEAVMRLGAWEVTNTALSVTLGRLVCMRKSGYCPDPEALWRHCVSSALACRHLRKVTNNVRADAEVVFTAGLLHDIGKIVINNAPEESVEVIAEVMREEGISAADAEVAVFGCDHAEMGGLILEQWKLPSELTSAVRFHHAPEFGATSLATLVHVGNCCAKVHATSRGWDEFEEALQPHVLERLGLTRWKIEDCWGDVLQSMDDIEKFVGR
jgi:putative nucleotidyltransferase with HDIG domain